MATRGSIPKIMELAGIDTLAPEAGVPLIRRELTAGSTRGEIVIGQRLGVLLNEFDSTGGLDSSAAESLWKISPPVGPMVGKVASMTHFDGFSIEIMLDPRVQPFLHDHQIDGTPVLPGVMGIEAFAEAALSLLPGWHVEAVEDVNFLAPFKFYRSEPRCLRVETKIRPQGDRIVVDCRLIGERVLPGQAEPQRTTHFTGHVRLTKALANQIEAKPFIAPDGLACESSDIYRLYFHGPAYQVLEKAWRRGNQIVGLMTANLPDNHQPPELATLASPRLIELCFQTAGVWELGTQSRMGLPQHVTDVRFFRSPALAKDRLYALITPEPTQGNFEAEVLDNEGNCYIHVTGYRTIAVPDTVDAEKLKALHAAMAADAALVA